MEKLNFMSDLMEFRSRTSNLNGFQVLIVDDAGRYIPVDTIERAFIYSNLLIRSLKLSFSDKKIIARVFGMVLD